MTKTKKTKTYEEFSAELFDLGYDEDVVGRVWDGLQLLSEENPMSERRWEKRGQERRRPHTRKDRVNRQADIDAPLELTRHGGPGVNPAEQSFYHHPGQKYYDPKNSTHTHRDKRSAPWDFMTTDQEVTKESLYLYSKTVAMIAAKASGVEKKIASKHPGAHSWYAVSDKPTKTVIGARIVHYVDPDDDKHPLCKFFDDEARPIWAPDFFASGYCIVFPHSMIGVLAKRLGYGEEEEEEEEKQPMSKFTGPIPRKYESAALQPRYGKGKPPPPREVGASVVSAQEGEIKLEKGKGKKKKELYLIPVSPEYTPLPMPDPTLKVGDWWEQMKTVPQGVSPFLAPGGVRVMGDSRRLSDVYREFTKPGMKDTSRRLLPGLGERFGPGGSGSKDGEKRDKDDLHQPKNSDMGGNDRTKVNPDGTKTSYVDKDSHSRQFGRPAIRVGAAMNDEIKETADGQVFREIGNAVYSSLGVEEWRTIHVLYKLAENVDMRAAIRERQRNSQGTR